MAYERTYSCRCGGHHAVTAVNGRYIQSPCPLGTKRSEAAAPRGRSHFNAKATVCLNQHGHPSKTEARVCDAIHAEWQERLPGGRYRIFRNVRLPLFNLPPTDAGIPHYCNVDFAVVSESGDLIALADAKSGKRSRDWERGRAAVEAAYGEKVVERDR